MEPNGALRDLRSLIKSAEQQQAADTDHPAYCVVRNGTISELIATFGRLDAALSTGGPLPEDWKRE